LARNSSLFGDKCIPAIQCVSQGLNILRSFKQSKKEKPLRQVVVEEVDKTRAWAYSGAS